jgi:hypothetical protein
MCVFSLHDVTVSRTKDSVVQTRMLAFHITCLCCLRIHECRLILFTSYEHAAALATATGHGCTPAVCNVQFGIQRA